MKIFTSTILIVLAFFSTNSYAADFEFIAKDNSRTTRVCIAAVTDNTNVMIKGIRRLSQSGTALSFRLFVNTIKCNNQYIGNFAQKYNAQNTFDYLEQYTNRWNKKHRTNTTIKDIVNEQGKEQGKNIVVLVASN